MKSKIQFQHDWKSSSNSQNSFASLTQTNPPIRCVACRANANQKPSFFRHLNPFILVKTLCIQFLYSILVICNKLLCKLRIYFMLKWSYNELRLRRTSSQTNFVISFQPNADFSVSRFEEQSRYHFSNGYFNISLNKN